jgi:hypothetical protein
VSAVNILGTKYTVAKKKYKDEPEFEKRSIDGYCDFLEKKIVYCDMTTYPSWEDEGDDRAIISEKQTIRHEIVHAFFNESGLCASTFTVDGAWAKNEEMVDWIALQGPKIYKAWQEAEAV